MATQNQYIEPGDCQLLREVGRHEILNEKVLAVGQMKASRDTRERQIVRHSRMIYGRGPCAEGELNPQWSPM